MKFETGKTKKDVEMIEKRSAAIERLNEIDLKSSRAIRAIQVSEIPDPSDIEYLKVLEAEAVEIRKILI